MKKRVNNRTSALKRFDNWYDKNTDLKVICAKYSSYLLSEQLRTLKSIGRDIKYGSRKYKHRELHFWQLACRDANLYTKVNNIETDLGYIYCIGNPQYPGWYKIGSSYDAETRLNSYQTSSPFRDYFLHCYFLVFNFREKEKVVHNSFKEINNEWVKEDKSVIRRLMADISYSQKREIMEGQADSRRLHLT